MRHHFVRSSAGLRDPNFKNVTLLLHGDGTNGGQNNTFLDSSGSNNAITRIGNVAQGSFSPYGDRWSNYFDGTGDYLTAPNNAAFQFGTGNVTIESWIYISGNSAANPEGNRFASICSGIGATGISNDFWWVVKGNTATTGTGVQFRVWNSGVGTTVIDLNFTISQNTWHHIAFVRSGNTAEVFFNGTSQGTSSFSGTITAGTNPLLVGYSQSGTAGNYNHAFNGYISNLRILKGTALYTSAFTPPTAPLTAITNTSLLTCQSNRFRDASSNNFAITRNGDVSVQRFSPFSPDAQYRTDRIAGSAYFDGNDYLQIANRALKFSSGFFTAECWVYISAYPASLAALFNDHYWQGGHNGGYIVYIVNTGQVRIEASNGNFNNWGGTVITSSNSLIRGQWNHLAIVRGANNLVNIYINGISTTTPVARTSFELNSGVAQSSWHSKIGLQVNDTNLWYGFTGIVSDLRVINGKCLYTANFTPPTEPLTAIPETTFLGRFANASIVDNAMMHNIETVADAQIDTTQKKFGTGALEFDGNGDYLSFKVINELALNIDFTVELWFYARASRTHRMFSLHASGTGASYFAGLRVDLNGNGTFGLYSSNGVTHSLTTSQGSWSVNTWTHLAITKSGNDFKFFKNGTQFYTAAPGHSLMTGSVHTIGMLAAYGADWFDGLIDDFRVTRGVVRYTSNFTPPTAPFPDF